MIVCSHFFRALLFGSVSALAVGTTTAAQTSPALTRTDLTLDAVLTAALTQNPRVAAARAQVTAAEGSRRTATTLPNPVATYWMENTRFPGQGPFTSLDREISAYATLPLEPFLQRSSRIAHADADLRGAQADVNSAERIVAIEAAHAFYRVALAQASLQAVQENHAAVQELVDYLRTRVTQGASPEGEMIRAEVERDRAATEVTLADVELLRAQTALRPLLGVDSAPLATLRVTTPGAALVNTPLAPFADYATHALAQRPELLGSRARLEAAQSAISVERSVVIRQLGASFGLKRTAGTNAMVAGVSMTVPLFDRNHGEIQRATGEQLAAEQELRWLERAIGGEVEAAYQVAARLTAHVAALQPAFLRRAEESRRIALGAYQEGAAPLLQVLDASRALTDAKLIYARALVAANESVFELGIAAGDDARSAARLGQHAPASADLARLGGVR